MHEALVQLAERQHGLVTRPQALKVASPARLRRWTRDGRLIIVRTGVYRFAGVPITWEQQVLAACLVGGMRSAASFATAAALWGFVGFDRPDRIEITIPSRQRARIPGIRVHDTQVSGRRHVTRLHAIPLTTPARTLCDLTASNSIGQVARALDDALRRRLTTLQRVERVFRDMATKGRRRSTIMRALLEERVPGFDPGESEQEAKLVRWIVGAGLPKPLQQHRVRIGRRTFRLDLAYPQYKLALEYDGWDTHRPRTAFDSDRERGNELRLAGWDVLHFTSRSTRHDVVRVVTAAIQASM